MKSRMLPTNALFYGDNLQVMREHAHDHFRDESVDLVYLDPPFNSARNYNVLFTERDDTKEAAQIKAFEDTWTWDASAAAAYDEIVENGGKVSEVMQAFRLFLGHTDMLAYLSMMAPRLIELQRLLKPTGSLYLHCDPTASHYLKLLLDAVFGPQQFRSEIVWKRSSAHSDAKQGRKDYGHIHDVILFYSKSDEWTWNTVFVPYDAEYVAQRFGNSDARGSYKDADLTAAKPGGDTSYEWRVKQPEGGAWTHDLTDEHLTPRSGWEYKGVYPSSGRFWAYSRENMVAFARDDKLHYFSSGQPRLKQYASELAGVPLQDLWTDIAPINSQAQERLGYPTQKPEALLERIIRVSSNEGDTVLDPFCGCGTAVAAAQKLGRRWTGIDITHLAINLIRTRLRDAYGDGLTFGIYGEPVDVTGAQELAETDPYQFQWWALGLVGARPVEQKKGADKGIDGRLYFHGADSKKHESVILSVKAGHVTVSQVRDLRGVIEREKAAIGVLISFEQPTQPMRREAAGAGFYETPWGKFPRLQLLTVDELLDGRRIEYPAITGGNKTYKAAPRAVKRAAESPSLFDVDKG